MPPQDTKERLLDTAEELFAVHGFSATSLRMITAEAGVNLASIHYHFGSKEKLIEAVFTRRLEPLNRERLRLLDACERGTRGAPGEGRPVLEDVLKAFLIPPFQMLSTGGVEGSRFVKLLGRTFMDPGSHPEKIIGKHFHEVSSRFSTALAEALPDLPGEEITWRFHFMIGTMAHTLAAGFCLEFLSEGRGDPTDAEGTLARLVPFLTAAMGSPAPNLKREEMLS